MMIVDPWGPPVVIVLVRGGEVNAAPGPDTFLAYLLHVSLSMLAWYTHVCGGAGDGWWREPSKTTPG